MGIAIDLLPRALVAPYSRLFSPTSFVSRYLPRLEIMSTCQIFSRMQQYGVKAQSYMTSHQSSVHDTKRETMYSPVRVYCFIGTSVGMSETFVERRVVYCFFVSIEVPVNLNFHLCCTGCMW